MRRGRTTWRRESVTKTTDDQEYQQLKRGRSKMYKCKTCSYKSERQFNVLRHEERIHDKRIVRGCCGLKFTTKGEWYKHCNEYHPGKRPFSKILSRIRNKRSQSPESNSDTSVVSCISSSPKERRYSSRIREKATSGLQEPQIVDSTDDGDTNECLQVENPVLKTNERESLKDIDDNSSTITGKDLLDQPLDESLELEEEIAEYQFGISENMGLEAFIEEIPLNLEPTQQFLQTLENPEYLSGDLLFQQGINSGDDEIVTPGEKFRDDQVALVLQEITQNHINYDNNNYVSTSTVSALLWNVNDAGKTYSDRSEILENQLPPKKKILKKYLDKENERPGMKVKGGGDCRKFDHDVNYVDGVDKENERPGVKAEGGGDFWGPLTRRQLDYISSFDFDLYKM